MNILESCRINLKLLPFKVHYFFVYAVFAGVFPYLPVLAKQLGISASAVGMTYSMLPFCSFVSRPLIGLMTDYFRKIKVFLVNLMILSILCLLSISFLPPISKEFQQSVHIQVKFNTSSINLPFVYKKTCLELQQIKDIKCIVKRPEGNHSEPNDTLCIVNISKNQLTEDIKKTWNISLEAADVTDVDASFLVLQAESQFNGSCGNVTPTSTLDCQPDLHDCLSSVSSDSISVYSSYQFWIFTLLAIVSGASASSVFSLGDVACYEVLGDQAEHYGRQRLWGTISWGIVCPLSGFLCDLASKNAVRRDFSPGFYLMLAFAVIDFISLVKVKMVKTKFSSQIYKDIKIILSSGEIIVFAVGCYITGALTSLIATYELWYLEDMGASQTLLGSTVAMQCLVGEVPFLFFSGWFVKKYGHFMCMAAAFVGFAVRLGLYSLIRNPWLALPIDILHGLTFAIFYATMTSFASQRGPFGMEATMLGVLGGLYDGLGPCTGSFLGGIGLDKLGGRHTFLVASIISIICVPIFAVAPKIINRMSSTRTVKKASFQTEMVAEPISPEKC